MRWLPAFIIGPLAAAAFVLNLLIWWTLLVLPVALIKRVLPDGRWRARGLRVLQAIAKGWIACNNAIIWLTQPIRWEVSGIESLPRDSWLLVISTHRSWVDIPVLQKVFNRRLPLLSFLLKAELRKVPLLGMAWEALDFPFMGRHSRQELEENPELAGRDLQAIRSACRVFRHHPSSIVVFVEGTRFSRRKAEERGSPYRNLLIPRAGGVAAVIDELGDKLAGAADVTILYTPPLVGSRALFYKGIQRISVRVRFVPIPDDLRGGDVITDPVQREQLQSWLNELWSAKDDEIEEKLAERDAVRAGLGSDARDPADENSPRKDGDHGGQ